MSEFRTATMDDVDRVLALEAQAFNISASATESRRKRVVPEQISVLEDGGRIVGSLRALPFAHFFGGRPVRAAGISGVAVAADARGAGVGRQMMRERLASLRADGVSISSLYPATVPLYRQMGYGFGGVRTDWRARLDALPSAGGLRVEEFDHGAIEELDVVYRAIARETNGLLERDQKWWRTRVLSDDDGTQYRYLVREDGAVTGWIAYQLRSSKNDWRSTVGCRDLFWSTPRTAEALLSLAAHHRSTSTAITWVGPPVEVLGDLTREDVVEHEHAFRYMIRLLDVPAALEARGYSPVVEAEVTLGVEDPLFTENTGPWRVRVSGGSAKVAPAEAAEARADVQTWASIWTSHQSARDAARMGRLTASERALDTLGSVFAGPSPWIADFY